MSHVPSHALARTEDKGGTGRTYKRHSPEYVDGREKAVKIVLGMGCPYPISPRRGKRNRENPTKLYSPFPLPRFSRNKERADRIDV